MPTVLTMKSSILCGPLPLHGGKVAPTGSTKLHVSGSSVLLESSIISVPPTMNITGCLVQSTNSNNIPCQSVASISSGKATKLTVGGKPVLLVTLHGQTSGTPFGTLVATETQTKLTAV